MTSTSGDTTVKFRPDAPAIVCGECGFRTARVASLIDSAGHEEGIVIACLPCRERERARTAGAATATATAAARRAAKQAERRIPVPHQRCAPAPHTPESSGRADSTGTAAPSPSGRRPSPRPVSTPPRS